MASIPCEGREANACLVFAEGIHLGLAGLPQTPCQEVVGLFVQVQRKQTQKGATREHAICIETLLGKEQRPQAVVKGVQTAIFLILPEGVKGSHAGLSDPEALPLWSVPKGE